MLVGSDAKAGLITTFDFTDGNWATTFTEFDTAVNESTVTAATITADKGSGSGGVRVEVDLVGSISTLGFTDLTLQFFGDTASTLEWNADMSSGVSAADGLRIFGSGIDINANGSNDLSGTAEEGQFDVGTIFPTSEFGTGFAFDPSVGNGSLSDLKFLLQVNAAAEVLSISSVQLHGNAVPEASELALLGLGLAGLATHRRRPSRR